MYFSLKAVFAFMYISGNATPPPKKNFQKPIFLRYRTFLFSLFLLCRVQIFYRWEGWFLRKFGWRSVRKPVTTDILTWPSQGRVWHRLRSSRCQKPSSSPIHHLLHDKNIYVNGQCSEILSLVFSSIDPIWALIYHLKYFSFRFRTCCIKQRQDNFF